MLIRYTALIGSQSSAFELNPDNGLISVASPNILDAEENSILEFQVEAADEDGRGLKSTTRVVVNLIDINDNAPEFERKLYEFILHPDRDRFTVPAFVKATDKDITSPNNDVHFEISSQAENLTIDSNTGELSIKGQLNSNEAVAFTVRAYDGGVPRLWGECEVRVYPPESHSRKMLFIVPGKNPDSEYLAKQLREITGAGVKIDKIRPYTGYEPGAADFSTNSDKER